MRRLLHAVLAWLTDASLAENIVGDLEEQRHRRLQLSRVRGRVWFLGAAIAIVITIALRKSREASGEFWLRRLGMSGLRREAWQALRALRRTPVATSVIIMTLAIGFGVNTAIFTVVYGVLFKPLPFADPGRVVLLEAGSAGQAPSRFSTSLDDYRDIARGQRTFADLGVAGYWTFNLTDADSPLRIVGVRVDGTFFRALGTPPVLGRWLGTEDDRPGAPERVVIGHGLWQSQFAGSTDAVGRELRLNGVVATVVGVMPPAFRFPGEDVQIWAAIRNEMEGSPRNVRFWSVVGRLAGRTTVDQANADVRAIAAALEQLHPNTNRGWQARVVPALRSLTTGVRADLMLLLVAVILVFVVSSVNVGAMIVSRYGTRGAELSVRAALGATPARLIRLSCLEAGWLASAGLALGLAVSIPAVALLRHAAPPSLPRIDDIALSWPVVQFAVVATGLFVAIASIVPIAFGIGRHRSTAIHEAAATTRVTRTGRARMTLVLVQVALSFVIAAGAGLLVRSFVRVLAVDPGFRSDRLLTLRVFLGPPKYRSIDAQRQFIDRALEAIRQQPGVTAAGAVSQPPFDTEGQGTSLRFAIDGRSYEAGAQPSIHYRAVDAGYTRTIGLPLESGRELSPDDNAQAPAVVLINRSLASKYWPNQNPVGARLRWADRAADPPVTIVGVVGNVATDGLEQQEPPAAYIPHTQRTLPFLRWMTFVVRTSQEPELQAASIRAALQSVDPRQPIFAVRTMQEHLDASLAERRFALMLMSAFAGLALLLTAFGLYGALAQSVEHRRRELGVRIALGAVPFDIFWIVLRRGLVLVVLGLAIGGAASYVANDYVRSLLFGVRPDDVLTRLGVAAVIVAISLLGSVIPARRAARVDPIVSLRHS